MQPVKNKWTTITLGRGNNPESVQPLPGTFMDGQFVSEWVPDPDERELIAQGGNILLWIHGDKIYPMGMSIIKPENQDT